MKTATILIIIAIAIGFYFVILAVNRGVSSIAAKIPAWDLSSIFGNTIAEAGE